MLKYRPDIDGLRAIAVTSVVLYHLKESLLPGGFVGVDIFFVISGYLITKLIFSELSDNDSFSFKRFYLRRIRRLFPALFATLLFSLALAYYLFSPAHLSEFAQSLVASIFSVSNIFFWNISDYFDSESTLKPLLHTWSLSVEEQFYFIWPAILVGLFSLKKPKFIPIFIVLMGIASLMLNMLAFSEHPIVSKQFSLAEIRSSAFYWLPFRVFEFSIGAILVWLNLKQSKIVSEAIFATGLVMVLSSMFMLDSKMNFPSTTALIPCLGAALMIVSGSSHRLTTLVSNRLMVAIGLISYSLYLIHWPLLVFYKYSIGREFGNLEVVSLLCVSIVLAALMYWFIEQPFRKPKTGGKHVNRAFLVGAASSTLLTVAISANAVSSKGWLWRYPADMVAQLSYQPGDYTEYFWANIKRLESRFEDNGKPKVLIIGDSMAADLVNILVAAEADQDIDFATVAIQENCKSFFGLNDVQYRAVYGGGSKTCEREHKRILAKEALFKQADTIILASYFWNIKRLDYVATSAAHVKSISPAEVMVLGSKTQMNNGIWFLHKNAFSPQAHTLRTPPNPKTAVINNILRKGANNYRYFDLLDLFCNAEGCQRLTQDGFAIIFDDSHVSENGAKFLARSVKETAWFKQLSKRKLNDSNQ